MLGVGAGGGGQSPRKKIFKISVFGQKSDAVWAKTNHSNFICT